MDYSDFDLFDLDIESDINDAMNTVSNIYADLDDFDDIPVSRPKKTVFKGFDTNAVEIEIPGFPGAKKSEKIRSDTVKPVLYPSFEHSGFNKEKKEYIFDFDNYYLKRIRVEQNEIKQPLCALFNQISNTKERKTSYQKNDFRIAYTSYLPEKVIVYYVWWRNNYLKGVSLQTDINYVNILITELLLFSEHRNPESVLSDLIRIGEDYPTLKFSLCEAAIYFCLSHGLFVPESILDYKLDYIRNYSSGKGYVNPLYELLICMKNKTPAKALIALNPGYDWRGSKCYNDRTKSLFDTLMPKALSVCVDSILAESGEKEELHEEKIFYYNIITSTFNYYMTGKPVTVTVKKVGHKRNLSDEIIQLQKYSENKIRDILGFKGKLHPRVDEYKNETLIIDNLFAPLLEKQSKKRKEAREAEPEYLKKYDVEKKDLNIDSAIEIEDNSWIIAEKMTTIFEEENPTEPKPETKPVEQVSDYDRIAKDGLRALLDGKDLSKTAKEYNLLPDTIVEIINNRMFEIIGDVCLEQDESGSVRIIEDYREETEEYAGSN